MNEFGHLGSRLCLPALAGALAAVLSAGPLAALAAPERHPAGGLEPADGAGSTSRPLALGQTEGYGEGKLLVLSYGLSYFCPTEAFADLDAPRSQGNGVPAAADPAEFQVPQCVVGDSGTGSVPTVGLSGEPISAVPKLWAVVPSFGGIAGNAIDPGLRRPVDTQCPEPGPPVHQRKGEETTCTMHPSALHAGHADVLAGMGPDPVPGPRHNHILDGTSSPFRWHWVNVSFVTDPGIWPDVNGNCRAGADNCLTSLAALRAAQASGQAEKDEPTNLFFFIKARPEAPTDPVRRLTFHGLLP